MDDKILDGIQKRIQDYEKMKAQQLEIEERESKSRIKLAEERQKAIEEEKKFEREAIVIYSGISQEGKTTIYEYEGKYYVGDRPYVQKRISPI